MSIFDVINVAAAIVSPSGAAITPTDAMVSGSVVSGGVSGSDVLPGATGCLGGSTWGILVIYALIIGVFYLVLIRPQNKRRKQEEAMRKSVEIGDEITTIGGICGRIVSIREDDTLVIETGADRSKLKIKNWAISSNETVHDVPAEEEPKKGFFSKFKKKNNEDEQ